MQEQWVNCVLCFCVLWLTDVQLNYAAFAAQAQLWLDEKTTRKSCQHSYLRTASIRLYTHIWKFIQKRKPWLRSGSPWVSRVQFLFCFCIQSLITFPSFPFRFSYGWYGSKPCCKFSLCPGIQICFLPQFSIVESVFRFVELFLSFLNPVIFLRGSYIYPHIEDTSRWGQR